MLRGVGFHSDFGGFLKCSNPKMVRAKSVRFAYPIQSNLGTVILTDYAPEIKCFCLARLLTSI